MSTETKQTVWLSKFALTSGIQEHQADIDNGKAFPGAPFSDYVGFKLGTEAHLTREDAVKAANAMVAKKITSLQAQLKKLEKKKF